MYQMALYLSTLQIVPTTSEILIKKSLRETVLLSYFSNL